MANRIQLYTAVTLLLLLLPTNESSCINPAFTMKTMKSLGRDALEHLENMANAALSAYTGDYSVGCIREAKEHDLLNCSIIHRFSSYLKEAVEIDGLQDDTKLHNKLNDIRQRLDDLKRCTCGNHTADDCEMPFRDREMSSENLEKIRNILKLFTKWFSKPME